MLVYLDNGENIKKHPNENFGRELLELFTMGVGNYTERDVREAARAFTGWTNDVLDFKFDAEQHDSGEKTFLGRTGPFNGEDIIDIILQAAGHRRVRGGEAVSVLRARGDRRAGQGRAGPHVPRQRLPDEAAAEAHLPLEGFLQPARRSPRRSRVPVHLVVSTYKKLGLREVPTIPDFGRMTGGPGPGAVRSAERRRLGRRPHLDHAVDAAAARQPVSRRAVPGRQGFPPARSVDVGHRRARRAAPGAGHGHHGSHQGRRRDAG